VEIVRASFRDDVVRGSGAAETFVGFAGDDRFVGRGGFDTIDYGQENGAGGVSVDLATGRAVDSFGDRDRIASVEHVVGTVFADTLTGNDLANAFTGLGGGDSYDGAGGIDEVRFSDALAAAGVTVDLAAGTATDGSGAFDTLVSIENVVGTGFADTIGGSAAANRLEGGGGADSLAAGDGADTVLGGSGADSLDGGRGADVLDGGTGNDALAGGRQADRFVFSGTFGNDRVGDFASGDVIDLTAIAGLDDFADIVQAVDSEGNAVAEIAGGTITFVGLDWGDLDEADFLV